ncbi:DUF6953 family protein [Aggregatibacter actinomycetemcomitans]|uniref:DUF6953 family protein n=1 Tax=Aggregatibacter actinomycetemcomitans TaxID=714 RepID=UPI00197B3E95|nr:hypothetical protein [Aggregatibacter actinomycetemcomitans]MBN6078620.1 hypothetical protein [Aggregatibacter actinomycetemcomitans]
MKINNALLEIISWMLTKLEKDECLYQDDVVDFLIKEGKEEYTQENSEGNQVLSKRLLAEFERQTRDNVVWVKSEFYWRFRVKEDEPGRIARG